jgi:hypothetical protein
MPKIPALPPISAPDAADLLPIEDVSANTTKSITLTKLKEWFQALAGWISNTMLADSTLTYAKVSNDGMTGADGWVKTADVWAYASATTFTVPGDQTTRYTKGTRVKFTQTTVKYGTVIASSYSAPNTTVTLAANNDYSIANAAISANFYSYAINPQGYPGAFSYTPTVTADSGTPTTVAAPSFFHIIGTFISLTGTCTVTNKGTAAGQIKLSTPATTVRSGTGTATEYAVAGVGGKVNAQGSIIYIAKYDGVSFWVNGYVFDYGVTYTF